MLARPRFTVVELGADFGGRKETVANIDTTVGIAHKTAIAVAVRALKAAVELTVVDSDD
jgi:hypothetical protein